ncbi:MAG: 2OG-Fe(II) oxygenase [Ilumatobacter sp.]|uniref:2OG-Fe(II) oxygenase n=1 Tax=Ilumatobacter sp. TaxID=1967498 RepID=UPI0026142B19|nr:2OG-Fe(II) oxygenase [Ilumatobacter sp.]MDJ0767618.1 2OG-Fe(II) oxygenase [Ilumatobacter sp.]
MTEPEYQHDDLDRILGYRDAIDAAGGDDPDDPDGPDEVADELYLLPFWTPGFCATVIRAAELVGGFDPDPADPVPGHEVSLASISPALFGAVQDDVGARIWPRLQRVWPLIEYQGLRDAFVIRYVAGEQESLRLHQDVAQVSASVRLNDGYDGAELTFPRQDYDNAHQPVGSLLTWPSLVTHPHEAAPLRSGVKYALTIWCELPGGVDVF